MSLRFCDYRSENISIVNRFQLHLKEKEGKKKKKRSIQREEEIGFKNVTKRDDKKDRPSSYP